MKQWNGSIWLLSCILPLDFTQQFQIAISELLRTLEPGSRSQRSFNDMNALIWKPARGMVFTNLGLPF